MELYNLKIESTSKQQMLLTKMDQTEGKLKVTEIELERTKGLYQDTLKKLEHAKSLIVADEIK